MNERITELYTQSLENKFDYGGGEGVKPGEYYSNYKTVLNAEKFAELIIQECLLALEPDLYESDIEYKVDQAFYKKCERIIKKHFGVDE